MVRVLPQACMDWQLHTLPALDHLGLLACESLADEEDHLHPCPGAGKGHVHPHGRRCQDGHQSADPERHGTCILVAACEAGGIAEVVLQQTCAHHISPGLPAQPPFETCSVPGQGRLCFSGSFAPRSVTGYKQVRFAVLTTNHFSFLAQHVPSACNNASRLQWPSRHRASTLLKAHAEHTRRSLCCQMHGNCNLGCFDLLRGYLSAYHKI